MNVNGEQMQIEHLSFVLQVGHSTTHIQRGAGP